MNENPDRLATNRLAAMSRIRKSVAWKGVVFIGLIGMTIVLSSNLMVYASQGLVIIGSFAIALLIPVLARRLRKVFKGRVTQKSVSDRVVKCVACGNDTALNGTYCENCGGKLITGLRTKQSIFCTQCQRPNPVGAKFCHFCGTQFQAQ